MIVFRLQLYTGRLTHLVLTSLCLVYISPKFIDLRISAYITCAHVINLLSYKAQLFGISICGNVAERVKEDM